MITLGKAVAQYEEDQVRLLWEAPDDYVEFKQEPPWILHGHKGSGKTTLLEYLQLDVGDKLVSILRPQEGELFHNLMPAIDAVASHRKNIETISDLVEVLAYSEVMRLIVADGECDSGPEATMCDFLMRNGLMEGSVIREALRYLNTATEGFSKPAPSIAGAADRLAPPDFFHAKTALKKSLKRFERKVLVCIDEIDESGFAYSDEDRIIVNGMLAFCIRANTALQIERLPVRFLLSLPTELLNHAHYWDSQKMRSVTHHLHWSDPKKLQNLVNKRIAIELNVHKRQPRNPGDRFSHEYDLTWRRVFPDSIQSKLGRSEDAFSYILRHTFYTPRNLLTCCQRIIDTLYGHGQTPQQAVAKLITEEWSQLIQKSVESFTVDLIEDILNVYGKIYLNLESTLLLFDGQPNIWSRGALLAFLRHQATEGLTSAEGGDALKGDTLLDALYRVGFLGFATTAPYTEHAPGAHLDLSFAFLGKHDRPRSWDFAVIAPPFYDYCHIKCSYGIPVVPHERLQLGSKHLREISVYDPLGSFNQRRRTDTKSRV